MELSRLRGRKICAKVLKDGAVWRGRTMIVRSVWGAPRHPAADPGKPAIYVGMLASTKLHKSAVKRNRMRRRVREALRTEVQKLSAFGPVQLLISPRSASLEAPFPEIVRDVHLFLTSLHGPAIQTQ